MDKKKINLKDLASAKQEQCSPNSGCCEPNTEAPYSKEPQPIPVQRRDFMKAMGLLTGGVAAGFPAMGNALKAKKANPTPTIPQNSDQDWIKSLYERGQPEQYTGKELVYIGMPIGGVTAGQVYLGGDGKLWLWKIFNKQHNGTEEKIIRFNGRKIRSRDGSNYVVPIEPDSPFEQGFKLQIDQKGRRVEKKLDFTGFKNITFKGQYPLAEVSYQDESLPVQVSLEAYSPFVPLDWESSSYPATVLRYTVHNTSNEEVECSLTGWLENAVHLDTGDVSKTKIRNKLVRQGANAMIALDAPVELAENKGSVHDPAQQRDYGSMAILLRNVSSKDEFSLVQKDIQTIEKATRTEHVAPLNERSVGQLTKKMVLQPGETTTVDYIISWYFPNLYPTEGRDYSDLFKGRYYKNKFANAAEVAQSLATDFTDLYDKTKLWVNTFYEESTLPHWFLNRTFVNTSILATETCYRLEDGRFWAWEGVGCCPGTCTHVWHYAQAMGRIFPEIEKNLREKTDFEVMDKQTGKIDFRAGVAHRDAADGQAGIVMRAYRDHQMSSDNSFLTQNWENIKLALNYLIDMDKEDGEANGMIFGEQHNTLDAEWYGNIPVITSLYLSALACGIEMAHDINDTAYADLCQSILSKGKNNIKSLYNKEYGYFVQKEDPNHSNAIGIGTGCYIDQVFGQGWAFQVGIGRLIDEEMTKTSLRSLYKHNYVSDMGAYREKLPLNLAGRPYALEGESGLVMCTWPHGGRKKDWEKHWQYGYFNECMTGFEYQAASHMMWEGEDLIEKSLILTRSIHDRYHPLRRNPYNEIECSDHYSRAMASYGVYLAACGFEYHGPRQYLGFSPRIQQDNFKAAFTAAEGWGTLTQKRNGSQQVNEVILSYGSMTLQKLKIGCPDTTNPKTVSVSMNGKKVKRVKAEVEKGEMVITFAPQAMKESDKMVVQVKY
jgi:uncharacterized protein (DUF608 family)